MDARRHRRRRQRSRRIRAVLAAGLVLGIGTVATLAAWTDTENARGSFASSVFGTESQSAGSPTYTSNTTAPGATLTFAATAMSPGTSFHAWLNIRTTTASTVGGTVSLASATAAGDLGPALQYRAVRMTAATPTATCNAATFTTGTPAFVAGASGTYLSASQVPATPVATTIGAGGAEVGFCIEVRIAPGAADIFQGRTGTVTWGFTAASTG
jgi:predicted ribosomally synthesized peptide with SipW-like signal peptide